MARTARGGRGRHPHWRPPILAAIRDYVLGDAFELAAFKGQPVTFRAWNGQLRQPILLSDGRMTISVSPQEGFLHQVSPLDTLGLDRPESGCTAFEGGD